ncbi:MAG TPA: hypothetical protein VIX91_07225 [Candidatus Acidoferrum sp.]
MRRKEKSAKGRGIGVIAGRAVVLRRSAARAEQIFDVILRVAAGGKDGDAFSGEEDVLVESVSGAIGFSEDFAALFVDIILATRL